MQTIYRTSLTPEQYAEQEHHRQVPPPECCPNCLRAQVLEALGYYARWISTATDLVLRIWVRRFECRHCEVTASCLPEFAQPYRVVNTSTVADGFHGKATDEVKRWKKVIVSYWKGFESHLLTLLQVVGNAFGSVPAKPTAQDFWWRLFARCGDLGAATQQLVQVFHTCLFGTYRCHQRRQPLQAA
jgi:hypothetical protein